MEEVVVVSGLPRSGTSMMMQLLVAGGITAVQDHIREQDSDNPKGYFEFEKVKSLKDDSSWVKNCSDQCIKVISFHLNNLPDNCHYKVVFMRREMDEIIRSQKKMLVNKKRSTDNMDKLSTIYDKHVREVEVFLKDQQNFDVAYMNYTDVLNHPYKAFKSLCHFLDRRLNQDEMIKVVDPMLYRNRTGVKNETLGEAK